MKTITEYVVDTRLTGIYDAVTYPGDIVESTLGCVCGAIRNVRNLHDVLDYGKLDDDTAQALAAAEISLRKAYAMLNRVYV